LVKVVFTVSDPGKSHLAAVRLKEMGERPEYTHLIVSTEWRRWMILVFVAYRTWTWMGLLGCLL